MCNNIESTDLFSSPVTSETYKINHYFNWDSKCLVYLITSRTCKLKYTGPTCEASGSVGIITGDVWRMQTTGEECKQKYLHQHFLQDDHYGFS